MARIRTIKPEFPQSESVGRLSRDARLLFIQLWTIADDAGRLRGASRMLASLLYPYDDDAGGLIDSWLSELERSECVVRYEVKGTRYLEITNWLEHQKIDRPSPSRLPPPIECSRGLANAREDSTTDLGPGPRTMDHRDDVEEARARADDDAGDGSKLLSDASFRIAFEVGKICGYPEPIDWPLGWAQAHYRVQTWLSAGWTEDQIIPACQTAMAGKRDGPPSTINYFDKPIAQWIARQAKPLPEVKIQERETISVVRNGSGRSVHDASRDFRAKLAEIQRPAPAAIDVRPGLRSGEGGLDVRLLPARRCE